MQDRLQGGRICGLGAGGGAPHGRLRGSDRSAKPDLKYRTDHGRRRDRFACLVRELGLPLSWPHPELSGDGEDAALHGRRRERPAWPFEPTRRDPLGGPDLQRPQRAACRASVVRPGQGRSIIVFFHGNNATLSRDVIARQQIVRQLSISGLNAVLIAPQLAVDAQDSSAGRFWSSGGFASFLGEAQSKLGDLYPNARGAFRRMPIVIVAYSGGYLPAAYSLAVGGDSGRVRGLVLLDALYGERDKFVSWAKARDATPSSSAPIRLPRARATTPSAPSSRLPVCRP